MKLTIQREKIFRPCAEKLNSLGSSFPLGSLIPGSRSSSKNLCAQACKGVCLLPGVYSNNEDVSDIASAGVLALKTYKIQSNQHYRFKIFQK